VFAVCGTVFVGLGECVYSVCGNDWSGFWGVNVCSVCDRFVWDWGSECVLFVGEFGVGLME